MGPFQFTALALLVGIDFSCHYGPPPDSFARRYRVVVSQAQVKTRRYVLHFRWSMFSHTGYMGQLPQGGTMGTGLGSFIFGLFISFSDLPFCGYTTTAAHKMAASSSRVTALFAINCWRQRRQTARPPWNSNASGTGWQQQEQVSEAGEYSGGFRLGSGVAHGMGYSSNLRRSSPQHLTFILRVSFPSFQAQALIFPIFLFLPAALPLIFS